MHKLCVSIINVLEIRKNCVGYYRSPLDCFGKIISIKFKMKKWFVIEWFILFVEKYTSAKMVYIYISSCLI